LRYNIYQDRAGQWRWRLLAANGEIVKASSEGFANKDYCYSVVDQDNFFTRYPVYETAV
jgi:uncharacterized protein YegP (UPF0339 family)